MHPPLVTVGVPVYRGQDALPKLLECLRTQTYQHIEVLISIDAADQASAGVCKPFLEQDHRFRMHVQPTRLGWAGNTDWTMRHRRGDFYIYQQHDDLISPTYIADLVEAAARWPNAVICFARLQYTGRRNEIRSARSLVGDPITRVLTLLDRLDFEPFRGLIRSDALSKTSGLLVSDFDPCDSLGTEFRFMAELALLGEFRFVEGPTYFKAWHGDNLSAKRNSWSTEHRIAAHACWAAWMIEVIAGAGTSAHERRRLFGVTLERFAGRQDFLQWIRSVLSNESKALVPFQMVRDLLKRSQRLTVAVAKLSPPAGRKFSARECSALRRLIFKRLRSEGRFDPDECLNVTWEALESEMVGGRRMPSGADGSLRRTNVGAHRRDT